MLKKLNSNTIEALSPWNIQETDETFPIFPEISKKKKKQKTMQSLVYNQEKIVSRPVLMERNQNKIQIQEKQNDLNFIRRMKKKKKKITIQKEVLCPRPLPGRKLVQSINYIPLSQQINKLTRNSLEKFQQALEFKRQSSKLKDVHSIYLIQKLRSISDSNVQIKKQPPPKILTQRGIHNNFVVKTETADNNTPSQNHFISKPQNYFTHRKRSNPGLQISTQAPSVSGIDQNCNLLFSISKLKNSFHKNITEYLTENDKQRQEKMVRINLRKLRGQLFKKINDSGLNVEQYHSHSQCQKFEKLNKEIQ